MANTFDSLSVTGALTVGSTSVSAQTRSTILVQDANKIFPIPWSSLRVWDAYGTNLPATSAADDLGLYGGTFASAPPMVQTSDLKGLGATTRYARFQVIVPECYDAGETVSIVVSAGMKTAIADASCVVDFEVYKIDKISGISADLCVTAATSINATVFSSKTFAITATTLTAGDVLDVRMTITCTDAATAAGTVIPTIAGLDLVCDIKG